MSVCVCGGNVGCCEGGADVCAAPTQYVVAQPHMPPHALYGGTALHAAPTHHVVARPHMPPPRTMWWHGLTCRPHAP